MTHWITLHGFALNVDPSLGYFEEIVPCGIHDRGVTSLARLLGRPIEVGEVADRLVSHFGAIFGRAMRTASASELISGLPALARERGL